MVKKKKVRPPVRCKPRGVTPSGAYAILDNRHSGWELYHVDDKPLLFSNRGEAEELSRLMGIADHPAVEVEIRVTKLLYDKA